MTQDLAELTTQVKQTNRYIKDVILDLERDLDKAKSRAAMADAYAGRNPMQHHSDDGITAGGMAGCAQMFSRLYSAEHAKYMAGSYLVAARRNRFLGYDRSSEIKLSQAAKWRSLAAVRPTMKQP